MRPSESFAGALRQALAFGVLAGLLVLMFHVTSANLAARGVHSGFAFLWEPARTPVVDSPLPVEAGVDSYAKAFVAGALNSLKLTLAGIVAATVVGVGIGLGRSSPNALARGLCAGYVEGLRNVPLLLQVFFWYGLVLQLPSASDAWNWGGWLLASNRGVHLAWWGRDAVGHWAWQWPALEGFDVHGGVFLSPEFLALFIAISMYTASYIAEIVRAAVASVPRGQWDAAYALGLSHFATLRYIVMPRALRVALPPLTSEYLGIFKNSTLAVAIGYQEFMAVSTTMFTETGQPVEIMAVVMGFYAVVSLVVSGLMHAYERRVLERGTL